MKAKPTFTIKQTGISEDTIRYYEKIALLPRAERKDNGHRIYRQEDIQTIQLIGCLKKTGMPLEEMRPFLAVSADADPAEYPELVERLKTHRENHFNSALLLHKTRILYTCQWNSTGLRFGLTELHLHWHLLFNVYRFNMNRKTGLFLKRISPVWRMI